MIHFRATVAAAALVTAISGTLADVYVTSNDLETTVAEYRTTAATFGRPFPDQGLRGRAVQAKPLNGCHPLKPPPDDEDIFDPASGTWIAVIARYGGCNFEDKVRHATEANYSGAIIFNVNSNKLVPMAGGDDTLIPSVFMGYDDAQVLLFKYTYEKAPDLRVVVTDDHPFDINSYLLPFAIVVGICFIIMLVIVVYKCIQDYRRHRRHRLPRSALRKLPIHKFKRGDPFETCCICLDDFEEGDRLRVLPCDHGYHAKCIDPWLVKTKRICPQCRKRVFESNERGAGLISGEARTSDDSDEDPEMLSRSSTSQPPSRTTTEQEPLLPNRRPRNSRFGSRNLRRNRRSRNVSNNGTFNDAQDPYGESGSASATPTTTAPVSAQERIRRAFSSAIGPNHPIMEEQDIISSEEYVSSSSDDEGGTTRRAVVRTANLQDTITVRIEQPLSPVSGRSSHLVAEVHVVPSNEPQAGPSSERPLLRSGDDQPSDEVRSKETSPQRKNVRRELSEEVVVMPPSSEDEGAAGASSARAAKGRKGKGKKSKKSSGLFFN